MGGVGVINDRQAPHAAHDDKYPDAKPLQRSDAVTMIGPCAQPYSRRKLTEAYCARMIKENPRFTTASQ